MWTVVLAIYKVLTAPHIYASIFNCGYLRCCCTYHINSMRVILQTLSQIHRTSSSLRSVNCGPGHIQCIYISAHSVFSIQLNVSALLLEISRQFNERYTAIMVPNTAHILQFTLCEMWSRPYTKYLQLLIIRPQNSTERICAAIGDISTIQCSLYCKLGAKYSAQPPVYAIWTVVADIYDVLTAPHIQYSIFSWTYLRRYWRYINNSMCVILQTWCQYSAQPTVCAIWTVVPRYIMQLQLRTIRLQYSTERICAAIGDVSIIQRALYCKHGAKCCAYLPVCQMWTVIPRYTMQLQFRIIRLQYSTESTCAAIGDMSTIQCAFCCKLGAKYSEHPPVYGLWTIVPDINNGIQFRKFRLQYLSERICAAIRDISTIQCALYCKRGAIYSAYQPDYALWIVVPDIYNVVTSPHIQSSVFNWTYLRSYWRHLDNSMLVILQTWSKIQRTSSSLYYVDCGPGYIQCSYSSAYSGSNIQLNISALLLEISRICKARHTANVVPNTAHTLQFTLCELWSRPYTM
jgi:hypothetical protein